MPSLRRTIITLAVTAAAVVGVGQVAINASCGCTPPKPEAKAWPVLIGTPKVGQQLTTGNGTWVSSGKLAAHPNTSYAYAWQLCNASGGSCTPISGQTSTTYTIKSGDSGSTIRSAVTATNDVGSTTQTSAPSATVTGGGAGIPVNTTAPTISGIPMPASSGIRSAGTLTATTGSWTNSPSSNAYQWQDCDATGANCQNATGPGATTNTYTVGVSDLSSNTIRVQVTASNASGSTTATAITGPAPALWAATRGFPDGTSSSGALHDASLFRLQWSSGDIKPQVDAAHADNPNEVLLQYDTNNEAQVNSTASGNPCRDANAAAAQANAHPGDPQYDWFLYNSKGIAPADRLSFFNPLANGGTTVYAMDVGNTYWQQACATLDINKANASDLGKGAHDGVYVDDMNLAMDHLLAGGNIFPGWPVLAAANTYTNDPSWNTALDKWTTALSARTHAVGLMTFANVGFGAYFAGLPAYEAMVNTLDGNEEQGFIPVTLSAAQDQYWRAKVEEGQYNESTNKWFIASFNYAPPGEAKQTFAMATFLMEANGHSVFDLDPINGQASTFYPSMIAAMQLGPAAGPLQTRSINGQTIYERDFANGVAVANPSQSTTPSFSPTPGGTYLGRDCSALGDTCSTLTNVSSLTLGADGGAVLLRP